MNAAIESREELMANARLIAAAPKLAAACLRAKPYLASLPGKYGRESADLLEEIRSAVRNVGIE